MSFVYPYFFWIMMIPFVIFVFLVLSNKEKAARVFDQKVLDRLRVDGNTLPMKLRNLILFCAIFFMIIALARPVVEKGEKTISIKGLSLMASIDISGSMRSKDIYPNRLEFAKRKLIALFKQMPTDEVGLTAFAHVSFMLAPFTSDKTTLESITEGVNESYINMASTDFTALGALASKMLKNKKPKILVVVSDGGDKEALKGFAQILKDEKITLYAILVGTERGAPVLDNKGKQLKTVNGSIAITQINKDLGEIAKESGGSFVIAKNGNKDIEELVSHMRAKFHNKNQGDIKIKERVEFFIYPLILAVLLLLVGFSSIPRREIASRVGMAIFILLTFGLVLPVEVQAGITDFQTIKAAQAAYDAKDYNESSRLYGALEREEATKNYDLGNAYYKANRLNKAEKAYKRAKGEGVDELQRLHNLGNVYFKKKKFDYAIKAYEEALKHGNDEDTKFNLELAKKQQKKQKQQKQQKKQKKNQKNKKKKDKDKKKNKNKNKNKKEKKNNQKKQKKQKKQDKKQDHNQKDGQKKENKEKQDKQSKEKSGEKEGDKKPSKAKMDRKKEMTQKELRKLMKKMGNGKMPTLMYRAGGAKKAKRSQDVNPW